MRLAAAAEGGRWCGFAWGDFSDVGGTGFTRIAHQYLAAPFFVQPDVINDQGDPLGTLAFVRSHSSLICGNLVRDRAGVHVC